MEKQLTSEICTTQEHTITTNSDEAKRTQRSQFKNWTVGIFSIITFQNKHHILKKLMLTPLKHLLVMDMVFILKLDNLKNPAVQFLNCDLWGLLNSEVLLCCS